MKVTLHPGAEVDLTEAAAFYEREGSAAVAARFVAEFKRVSNLLREHPGVGTPRSHGRRSFSMSVFPYTVIYRPMAMRFEFSSSNTIAGAQVLVDRDDRLSTALHIIQTAKSSGTIEMAVRSRAARD